ncbi:lipid kinase YegS [Morganella morganii]|uniref:lipid kinase YegS n=1 Tax=Morganella morganii TaxID=582 RepID=UPI00128AE018|nr:lipid kinase YegS [Morganella morganii]MQC05842.1 lipid kinase YegS [Morganella morganii]MQC11441.1 lipid kinase YegS [Morganella morganii]MQC13617.1 lipid kinase YegS [Morganella morganii]
MAETHIVVLNGKRAGDDGIRQAVRHLRKSGEDIQVRVTWEPEDIPRFVREAHQLKAATVIAAGGDGTINAVCSALMAYPAEKRPVLGILPLGTANDFATAAGIPADKTKALLLAAKGSAVAIDIGCINESHYFINMATGGFGPKITTDTPEALKSTFGGAAYFLHGLTRSDLLKADHCTISCDDFHWQDDALVIGVGNGCQAGGGHKLCPDARINDGLLNLSILPERNWPRSLWNSLFNEGEAEGVIMKRSTRITINAAHEMVFNLDGEPLTGQQFTFSVLPEAIQCRLPPHCGLLS